MGCVCLLVAACAAPATPAPTARPGVIPTSPSTAAPTSDPAYLGQERPGLWPLYFATEFINGDLHTPPVFLPDGREAYWSTQEPAIRVMRLVDGRWTQPESVSFSAAMTDYRDPFIAPSGQRLYFLSTDVPSGTGLQSKENIWSVERMAGGWADPAPLPAAVNDFPTHWQVSSSSNGDLYFTSGSSEAVGDIYVAAASDGSYLPPEALPTPVNTDAIETTPFVDPGGRFLLFARLLDTASTPHLFVAWRDVTGRWGHPLAVESIGYALCPAVSPDGRYLFFLSSPTSVSWVSMEVVERLAPD
jgi:hypothetical protein